MESVFDAKSTLGSRDADLMTADTWSVDRNNYANAASPNSLHTHTILATAFFIRSLKLDLFRTFWSFGINWRYQVVSFVTPSNNFGNLRHHVQNSLWMLACHWLRLEAWPSSWPMREEQLQPPLLCQYCRLKQFSRGIGISVSASSMSTETDVKFFVNSWAICKQQFILKIVEIQF